MWSFITCWRKYSSSKKCSRPDTCNAVSLLTMRVREPENYYWAKLVHLIKYIRVTSNFPLILSSDGSGILKWYIDGSFVVYPNMRGNTGGGLSMGIIFTIVSSTKQKLNTQSSTETQFVEVDGCMSDVIFTRYWLDDQGYYVFYNIVFQDDKKFYYFQKISARL